jgi:predicted DNA-binding transcriptional regulator YafY
VDDRVVVIDYTNWRGERRERLVVPERLYFGSSPWHEGEQWLLEAADVASGETKTFAMSGVRGWRAAP